MEDLVSVRNIFPTGKQCTFYSGKAVYDMTYNGSVDLPLVS